MYTVSPWNVGVRRTKGRTTRSTPEMKTFVWVCAGAKLMLPVVPLLTGEGSLQSPMVRLVAICVTLKAIRPYRSRHYVDEPGCTHSLALDNALLVSSNHFIFLDTFSKIFFSFKIRLLLSECSSSTSSTINFNTAALLLLLLVVVIPRWCFTALFEVRERCRLRWIHDASAY